MTTTAAAATAAMALDLYQDCVAGKKGSVAASCECAPSGVAEVGAGLECRAAEAHLRCVEGDASCGADLRTAAALALQHAAEARAVVGALLKADARGFVRETDLELRQRYLGPCGDTGSRLFDAHPTGLALVPHGDAAAIVQADAAVLRDTCQLRAVASKLGVEVPQGAVETVGGTVELPSFSEMETRALRARADALRARYDRMRKQGRRFFGREDLRAHRRGLQASGAKVLDVHHAFAVPGTLHPAALKFGAPPAHTFMCLTGAGLATGAEAAVVASKLCGRHVTGAMVHSTARRDAWVWKKVPPSTVAGGRLTAHQVGAQCKALNPCLREYLVGGGIQVPQYEDHPELRQGGIVPLVVDQDRPMLFSGASPDGRLIVGMDDRRLQALHVSEDGSEAMLLEMPRELAELVLSEVPEFQEGGVVTLCPVVGAPVAARLNAKRGRLEPVR